MVTSFLTEMHAECFCLRESNTTVSCQLLKLKNAGKAEVDVDDIQATE